MPLGAIFLLIDWFLRIYLCWSGLSRKNV